MLSRGADVTDRERHRDMTVKIFFKPSLERASVAEYFRVRLARFQPDLPRQLGDDRFILDPPADDGAFQCAGDRPQSAGARHESSGKPQHRCMHGPMLRPGAARAAIHFGDGNDFQQPPNYQMLFFNQQ